MKRTSKKPINPAFKILCLDPSLTAFGYSVLQGRTILEVGCIKTESSSSKLRIRKGDDRMRRVSEINHVLLGIIHKYNIGYIIAELPHGSQSASAAISMGLVSAIAQTIADTLDIGIEWFSEGDAKHCLLNKQSATKQAIIEVIDTLYDVPWTDIKYKDEAIADSLAIHYVASKHSPILKVQL